MATIQMRILPSGLTRWQVNFTDANAVRRAKLFERKKDADAYMVVARAQVRAGTFVSDADALTVGAAADAWLAHCRLRRDTGRRMERATCRDYEDKVRLHIKHPETGVAHLKLSRLTRKAVNDFRDRMLAAGRSDHLTRRTLSVLKLLLNHAIDNGHLHINPAQGVRVIRTGRIQYKVPVPSKETVRNLIDAADEDFKPMLIVSALCGLRASELRGLRWADVDYENGFIRVRQRADFYQTLGEPKSAAGLRDVPAGPMVLNALRRWRLRCTKGDLDLVFPNRIGGIQMHANILKRRFKPLCAKVGVVLRWHDMRHFAVSLWIEQGFSIKEVMTFAGHSSVQMTMERYGHLFPTPDHQRAMAQVEAKLFG